MNTMQNFNSKAELNNLNMTQSTFGK